MTLFRAIACAAGCLFFSIGASADDIDMKSVFHEISIGVLDHDTDNLWSGFSRESGADINFEALFSPSYEILGGAIRPAVGASINTSGDTSKLYAGARWRYEFEQGIFVGIGLGAAVHNGDTDLKSVDKKALGSKVLRQSGTRGSLLVIPPLRISKKDLLTNQLPIPSTKTTVKAKSDKIMDLV